ncbi:hypothetical protein ACP6L2_10380 [Sphingobacterium lactis]|uniref:hypothetical protein n=1 Tax=Sphingobacterium lactis TaxID=797291 RepID=UPI003F7F6839
MKPKLLFFLISLTTFISCSKNEEEGYYAIETMTNTLDVPVKVELGRVTEILSKNDLDFNKNLKFGLISIINPKQTVNIDSTFVCTKNCKGLIKAINPERRTLFLRLSYNDKVKIDTNCQHHYVSIGIIQNCQEDKKNYFNKNYWDSKKDNSGNIIKNFRLDNSYLTNAE